MTDKLAYSIRETAKLTGTSERVLRRWVSEGKLPVAKSGNRAYLTLDALEAFLARGGANEQSV